MSSIKLAFLIITLALAACSAGGTYGSKQEATEAKDKWLDQRQFFTHIFAERNPQYTKAWKKLRCARTYENPSNIQKLCSELLTGSADWAPKEYIESKQTLSTRKCEENPNLTFFQYTCRERNKPIVRKSSEEDKLAEMFDADSYVDPWDEKYKDPGWKGSKFVYFRAKQ